MKIFFLYKYILFYFLFHYNHYGPVMMTMIYNKTNMKDVIKEKLVKIDILKKQQKN